MTSNTINKFPDVIYFCNKSIGENERNAVNNWKKLNPEYEIKLYDDEMCKAFLLEHFGKLHCDIFDFLKDGPIKADFWRVCILYIYGGIYSDIDNKPLVAIRDFVEPDVDFLICSSVANIPPLSFNFNPNLIMCCKGNEILKRSIDWYIQKYNAKIPYAYWDYSVVRSITDVLHIDNYKKQDGIYYVDGMKIQILKEVYGASVYDAHNIYKSVKIFYNRYENWNHSQHKFF
jgi:mannosyltransferase OCH1-like enzyme